MKPITGHEDGYNPHYWKKDNSMKEKINEIDIIFNKVYKGNIRLSEDMLFILSGIHEEIKILFEKEYKEFTKLIKFVCGPSELTMKQSNEYHEKVTKILNQGNTE